MKILTTVFLWTKMFNNCIHNDKCSCNEKLMSCSSRQQFINAYFSDYINESSLIADQNESFFLVGIKKLINSDKSKDFYETGMNLAAKLLENNFNLVFFFDLFSRLFFLSTKTKDLKSPFICIRFIISTVLKPNNIFNKAIYQYFFFFIKLNICHITISLTI
ncbi:hypothetical protein TRFO_38187 [Tritrichomonas foetus]|uniref:Uncharacterized protein n=1 Tax=Tritrichomonas foetus TaxID=1144522 RepID=A0A1J4J8Z6_9EUKA|nr:hypothetical protein TRFO_38187 [Tritrichomonas foetus]|eukprot:OHS95658.1 hypothetical protein TRFO_38187 [Tritrichomonas foetus]